MKKLLILFTVSAFFVACQNDNPNSNTNINPNKDSIQTTSHDSTIIKPVVTDTANKNRNNDSTNSQTNPSK